MPDFSKIPAHRVDGLEDIITGNYVKKNGDTMTGTLIVEKNQTSIIIKDNALEAETTPASSNIYGCYLDLRGQENVNIGRIAVGSTTEGYNATILQTWANNQASNSAIAVLLKKDGTDAYAVAPTPAASSNGNVIATTSWVRAYFLPAGIITMSPLSSLNGYLLCNGQAVSRTTYAALFAAIGTNFGAGDGSTTFNVPDYRGCFLRGLGGDSAVDTHTKQAMAAPNITGYVSKIVRSQDVAAVDVGGAIGWQEYQIDSDGGESRKGGTILIDASQSNSVYGAANEIRPVNYAINYFIKY